MTALAALSLVATQGLPASAAPTATADCTQPYQPWFQTTTYPVGDPVPDLGTSLRYTVRPPDTDNDGVADTIVDDTDPAGGVYQSLTITRGDGTITLLPGPGHSYIYLSTYGPQPGDLNGDGRDELIVGVDAVGEQYLLPGTTTPGTHDIASVGISLAGLSNVSQPVGDQNGDHRGDLAFPEVSGWSIYSGADLMAPGPGGTVGPPTPIATYSGTDLSAVVLVPGAVPTIITGHPITDTSVSLTVHGVAPVELTASGVVTEYTGGVGGINAYHHDGQTFVTQQALTRSGSTIAIWDLTDPCSRYGVSSPTTTTSSTTTTTTSDPSTPSSTATTSAAATPDVSGASLTTAPAATAIPAAATYTG
ncbi:MAG TPA: hypothetical protein VID05_00860 [Acidimicrobiales bacterium]